MLLASAVSFASGDIQERDGKCFLWEIDSKTATVYLMGSFHMFKPEMYPLNYCFTDAFKKADTMVVEVNLNKVDENQMAKLFADKGIYQGDVTIEQRLSKETMEKLVDLCRERNIGVKLVVYPNANQVLSQDIDSLQARYWSAFAVKNNLPFLNLFCS